MFSRSATLYDALYNSKDYEREAQIVHQRITGSKRSAGRELLDVACGTGQHLHFMQAHYEVSGLDISPDLLEIARSRCPGVPFYRGDMVDFALESHFDVLTCLFSAIGYVKIVDRLRQAIANMARHLKPGGVLIVEPWFAPEDWNPGSPHATFVDRPDLKIARLTVSEQLGLVSRNDFHYLVATSDGVEYFTERHELGLFTHDEYLDAFRAANLDVTYDSDGLTGRGLYVGIASGEPPTPEEN